MNKLCFLFLLNFISFFCNAQTFQWANKVGVIKANPFITVDAIGNSYVCGSFIDTCYFGASYLVSTGLEDIFLCKYDSLGVLQWAQRAGGATDTDEPYDICSDASGNVYVIGVCWGGGNFGSTVLSPGDFIAKYSPTGSLIWVKHIDSVGVTYSTVVAVGDSGKLFIGGIISNPQSNFGCAVINNTPYLNYIACYDTSGNCQWVQTFVFQGYLFDMAVDKDNNAYLTGAFLDSATFGSTVLNSAGWADIYLAKCNSNGSWIWALSVGSTGYDQGSGITIDKFNHLFLTGYFNYTPAFGCSTLTTTGSYDIYTSRYDTSGNCIWVQQAGGGYANQYALGITSDNYGNCIITGDILDTTLFGNFTLIPGGENMYVVEYDSTGLCKWAVESTGVSGDRGTDIGTDSFGNIYVVGPLWVDGIHNFGSYSLNANYLPSFNMNDMFVTKINNLETGITNLQSSTFAFQLYPNPAHNTFTISLNTPLSTVNCQLSIFDVTGRVVHEQTIINQESTIINTNLSAGVYLLKLIAGEKVYAQKLVVE